MPPCETPFKASIEPKDEEEGDPRRLEQLAMLRTRITDFDYLRISICDVHGIPRGKLVPVRNALKVLKKGMGTFVGMLNVNPRSVDLPGLKELISLRNLNTGGNLVMYPDLVTFRSVSWVGEEKTRIADVICQLRNTASRPVNLCPRTVAMKQLARLERAGFTILSGMELEFMLLQADSLNPVYKGADWYSNLTLSDHMSFMTSLEQGLHRAGININDIHVEPAQGQFEINYEPTWGILGADWPFIIRGALKDCAAKAGLTANFMGRPFPKDPTTQEHCGNGTHFNHSLWNLSGSRNLFRDEGRPDNVSDLCRHWVAGLIKHVNAMTALLCPTVNCYRRMHGPWAPSIPSWGVDDRFSTFRVKNFGKTATYIENRIPSGLANPYLALAVNIAAGLDGVINKLSAGVQRNGVEMERMPCTLEESLAALQSNQVMREALGEDFVDWFSELKRQGEIDMLPLSNMKKEDDIPAFEAEMAMYGKFC